MDNTDGLTQEDIKIANQCIEFLQRDECRDAIRTTILLLLSKDVEPSLDILIVGIQSACATVLFNYIKYQDAPQPVQRKPDGMWGHIFGKN